MHRIIKIKRTSANSVLGTSYYFNVLIRLQQKIKKVLLRDIKNSIEVLSEHYWEGSIYIDGASQKMLISAWREIHSHHQMPGWVATSFEDGEFWVSRWHLWYLPLMEENLIEPMGMEAPGIFYLLNIMNETLISPCMADNSQLPPPSNAR